MITLRPYQKDIMDRVTADLEAGAEEAVIAVCPSGGKTIMTVDFILKHPSATFLILAHGTKVIKERVWGIELEKHGIDFSDQPGRARVCCTLPQSIHNEDLPDYDFIIIDEAHEFNFASMVMKIKNKTSGKKLYLTGTPSKFVALGHKIYCVPALQLIQEKHVSDLYVGMVSTCARIEDTDHNKSGDIKETSEWKLEESVNSDLDNLLHAMIKRLSEMDFLKGKPNLRRKFEWAPTLGKLHKTLIACQSIAQADKVTKYFQKNGVNVISSESKTDPDCLNIEKFENDPDIRVLVVVNRAILGFNMVDLVNVVDLTCSRNIDRIYQLYARVMRKSDKYEQKYFFKFSSEENMAINKAYMNAAIHMMKEDFITRFNGKNLKRMSIKVKIEKEKSEHGGSKSGGSKGKTIIMDAGLFEEVSAGSFLIDIENKLGRQINEYAYTTFEHILRQSGAIVEWSLESLKADALKYNKRGDWQKASSGYQAAVKRGFLEECCSHMETSPNSALSDSEIVEEAKKFTNRKEWKTNGRGYQAALRRGLIDTCTEHMETTRKSWSDEEILNEAKKYNTILDFRNKACSVFTIACSRNLINQCTAHMKRILSKPYTLEELKADALNYKTKAEWRKSSPKMHTVAQKRPDWMGECCSHMIPVKNTWDKEKCLEDAKRFTRKSDWATASSGAVQFARKHGWFEECCKHMSNN